MVEQRQGFLSCTGGQNRESSIRNQGGGTFRGNNGEILYSRGITRVGGSLSFSRVEGVGLSGRVDSGKVRVPVAGIVATYP